MKHNYQNTATKPYQLKHIKCNDTVVTGVQLNEKHNVQNHRTSLKKSQTTTD